MESCCRACSRSDEFRRFSLYAVAEVSQEVIANMIRDTSDTQVSTEDGLPQQICPDCLMTLSLAYSFRKQCRRSDAKFREYWGGRAPSQPVDQQHQHQQQQQQQQQQNLPHQLPRRSQSQVQDEGSFEATTIKEEVDIYDYEYSVTSGHDDQWVIQNPRTIGEGAMTVVHNTGGQYYDDAAAASETSGAPDRDGHSSMLHPMDDASEMGECSGLGQDKLKKKAPSPERFSQRIRRQETSASLTELTTSRSTEPTDWGRWSVSVIPAASLMAATTSAPSVVTTTGQQQRCQHCQKKMKKPYKHRNGKCLEPKYKSSSRPKCAYCHQAFTSSKGIPSHLRNSCRVYRQVCEAKGISLPAADQSSSPYDTSSAPSETPEPPANTRAPMLMVAPPQLNAKSAAYDQKSKIKRTKPATTWSHSIVCQYCNKKFLKKSALNRHLQKQCLVWVRKQTESLAAMKAAREVTTSVPLPMSPAPLSDDKSAIIREQLEQRALAAVAAAEEITKCVYCQQNVHKKSRFLHHNGRCVLGRVNAEHPCPHCPEAFMTRSLLLKHRCDPALKEQINSTSETVPTNAAKAESKQRRMAKLNPKQLAVVKAQTPTKQITPRKQREIHQDTPTSIVKREFCTHCRQRIRESDRQKHADKKCFNNNEVSYNCGYCRKGFAVRDNLIEHQRNCSVRKQHKQVKCQSCGLVIANRAYLKRHQKVYCKSNKPENDVKSEKPDKPQKPQKVEKTIKSPKPGKPLKSEKPVKLKTVKAETPVEKKKRKIKKDKTGAAKAQDEDVENIPLKQRKVQKPKSTSSGSTAVEVKKPKQKPVMGSSKKMRFSCEYCKRKCETDSSLRRHRSKCSVRRATLTIICQHCSQRFSRQGNLERHLRLKCKNINRDEGVDNQTTNEVIPSDTTAAMNSTLEDDHDAAEDTAAEVTEQEPLDDAPSEPHRTASPAANQTSPEPKAASEPDESFPEELPPPETSPEPERSSPEEPASPIASPTEPESNCPEPVALSTDIAEQSQEPAAQILAEQPQSSTEDAEMEQVPESENLEIILPEEKGATTEEVEMEEVEEPEPEVDEPVEPVEEHVAGTNEAPLDDDHHEPENKNAEREKSCTPDVAPQESAEIGGAPEVVTIERQDNDDSQQSTESPVQQSVSEPEPAEPMQVDQSEN